MTTTAAKVISIASSQLGVHEEPPFSNLVLYSRWYGMPGSPWCDMFVSWVLDQAGLGRTEGRHAYTPAHVAAFKARGRWHDGPVGMLPGDVLFFDFPGSPFRVSHVGFAASPWTGQVTTLEGNTNGSGSRDGGSVMRHIRRASIVGYGRPAYSAVAPTVESGPPPISKEGLVTNFIGVVPIGGNKKDFYQCSIAGGSISCFAVSESTAHGLATEFFGEGGLTMHTVSQGYINMLVKASGAATNRTIAA